MRREGQFCHFITNKRGQNNEIKYKNENHNLLSFFFLKKKRKKRNNK